MKLLKVVLGSKVMNNIIHNALSDWLELAMMELYQTVCLYSNSLYICHLFLLNKPNMCNVLHILILISFL